MSIETKMICSSYKNCERRYCLHMWPHSFTKKCSGNCLRHPPSMPKPVCVSKALADAMMNPIKKPTLIKLNIRGKEIKIWTRREVNESPIMLENKRHKGR